jgi:hypothetical protein
MAYDWTITIKKGLATFVLAGLAALVPFFQAQTAPEVLIWVPIIIAVLTMLINFLKHYADE